MRLSHLLLISGLALLMLGGCAEYKEYQYEEYQASREDTYNTVKAVLAGEGYDIASFQDLNVQPPEIYIETSWNMNMADDVYKGNNIRRRAYVRLITAFTDRKLQEFQPLEKADKPKTPEEIKAWDAKEAERKKGKLEITRVGIAVRRERRNEIQSPLDVVEGDWHYDDQDGDAVKVLFGNLDVLFGEKNGAGEPSARSIEIRKHHMEESNGNR